MRGQHYTLNECFEMLAEASEQDLIRWLDAGGLLFGSARAVAGPHRILLDELIAATADRSAPQRANPAN